MIYSQGGEQEALMALGLELGHLLDIGAADGITFSNSRALIEAGWQATLVEPSFDHFAQLYALYQGSRGIDLVNAAVGTQWSFAPFHHTPDFVSTLDQAHFEKWRGHAAFDGLYYVAVIPIDALLGSTGPHDIVMIDTEGTSASLFQAALDHGPKVIVIEHDEDHTIEQRARVRGYRCVYADPQNWIFAR